MNSAVAWSGQAYHAAKEEWLKQVLADRDLSPRGVRTATAIYFWFNQEHFNATGELWAWPGSRRLDKMSGQSKKTVLGGIKDLEKRGHLKVVRRFDAAQGRRANNHYYAICKRHQSRAKVGEKSPEMVAGLHQGGVDGYTRVGYPGTPYSMTYSMIDSLIQTASQSASFAPRSEAHASGSKQEVGERPLRAREDASLPRPPLETEYAAPFEEDDVKYVQNLILSEVGWGRWMTIQKIVAMCREPGVYEYPIDGRQLGAMAKAGYLGRRGDHVWVDKTRKLAPGRPHESD